MSGTADIPSLMANTLGSLALYEASACHVLAVNPRTREITEATPLAPGIFGYESLDGVAVAELVPPRVDDHDALFDSFVDDARAGSYQESHQMGGRVLTARRRDGTEFKAVIILRWEMIRDADRVVATIVVHG